MRVNDKFTKSDLIALTTAPLEEQYARIQAKIFEAISITHGDILVCFSGGKDSALMLDMYCDAVKLYGITKSINVAFADTTNETSNMYKYVDYFIAYCQQKYDVKINFEKVRPDNNDNFVSVAKREGLPFVSKMVAATLRKVSNNMNKNGVLYKDIVDLHQPTVKCRDALREMKLSDTTVLALTGWSRRSQTFGKAFVLPKKWMPLLNISEELGVKIDFSEKCCEVIKKGPISHLKYKNIMTGEQAMESKTRESRWLLTGCTHTFDDGSVRSKPLGSVSPQAVLYALHTRQIPICADYGNIVCHNGCYRCSGAQRTGCALCGFGIQFDPERFARLQMTEPAKVRLAFKPLSDGGLGYKEICEYANEHCRTSIVIPKL